VNLHITQYRFWSLVLVFNTLFHIVVTTVHITLCFYLQPIPL
jgi:hypothetical protein